MLVDLDNKVDSISTDSDVDACISSFEECIETVCNPVFGKDHTHFDLNSTRRHETNSDVYLNLCEKSRVDFYRLLNIYRRHSTDLNRVNMTRARSVYKKNVRRFNFEQDKFRTAKLLSVRFSNAKLY